MTKSKRPELGSKTSPPLSQTSSLATKQVLSTASVLHKVDISFSNFINRVNVMNFTGCFEYFCRYLFLATEIFKATLFETRAIRGDMIEVFTILNGR